MTRDGADFSSTGSIRLVSRNGPGKGESAMSLTAGQSLRTVGASTKGVGGESCFDALTRFSTLIHHHASIVDQDIAALAALFKPDGEKHA